MKEIKNKTISMKYIENITGNSIEELLHKLYIEEGLSIREISEKIGVHYHTVNKWLKLAKINVRLPHDKLLDLLEIKERLKESKENV